MVKTSRRVRARNPLKVVLLIIPEQLRCTPITGSVHLVICSSQ
jgi:hypothetical protein